MVWFYCDTPYQNTPVFLNTQSVYSLNPTLGKAKLAIIIFFAGIPSSNILQYQNSIG